MAIPRWFGQLNVAVLIAAVEAVRLPAPVEKVQKQVEKNAKALFGPLTYAIRYERHHVYSGEIIVQKLAGVKSEIPKCHSHGSEPNIIPWALAVDEEARRYADAILADVKCSPYPGFRR